MVWETVNIDLVSCCGSTLMPDGWARRVGRGFTSIDDKRVECSVGARYLYEVFVESASVLPEVPFLLRGDLDAHPGSTVSSEAIIGVRRRRCEEPVS